MSGGPLQRAQYRNVNTGTVRTGATGHGESLVDIEDYLLPIDGLRNSALHGWGVVTGLRVRATPGASGLAISLGSALDSAGRLVTLAEGSVAVVDPTVGGDQILDVPTVPVTAEGISLDTAGTGGELYLTLTWREVQRDLADAPVLMHAPWARLVPEAGFADVGRQVVLARVSLGPGGEVTALTAGRRRLVELSVSRLELRVPRTQPGETLDVGQQPAAELTADENGNLALNVLRGPSPRQALAIDAATGNAVISGALSISTALQTTSTTGQRYDLSSGGDGKWRLTDATAGSDRLVVDGAGNVGIGIGAADAQRTVHVEGSEVHSGGGGGGFSFADRNVGGLVDRPRKGERWVWYAHAGAARLWSQVDRLVVSAAGEGGGLDVSRRMRVRQGGDGSAGIWFHQDAPNADRAFVGMRDDNTVGFFGQGAGWALRTSTTTGQVEIFGTPIGLTVNGGTESLFGIGVRGRGNTGVWAEGNTTGVLASGGTNAGFFHGKVTVTGDLAVNGRLTKGGGGFRIDDPLDPEGRYLSHSFVECPEMLTVYAGDTETDDRGEVVVVLPEYFERLNRDHRFQVTTLGQLALATVDGVVRDNAFTIRTDRPHVRVSWLVTGVRQDPWAESHRVPVQEDKPEGERGRYLHAQAYGRPEEMQMERADLPE
jgi:hypothetical protein